MNKIKNQEAVVIPTIKIIRGIEIHKIRFGDIGKLKGVIEQIIKVFAKRDELPRNPEEAKVTVLNFLPDVLTLAPDAVAEILELSTNKTKKEILNTDLDLTLEVCRAVIGMNEEVFGNFFGLMETIVKATEKIRLPKGKELVK